MTLSDIVGSLLACAALGALNPCTSQADDSPPGSPDSVAAPTATTPETEVATASLDVTPPPDRFPFADNPLPWKPFAIGAGFGAGAYAGDLSEVDRVFERIENSYRAQGWTIPHASPAKLDVMRLYSMTARFEKVADVTVQLGRSGNSEDGRNENHLRTNALIVSRRIVSSSEGNLALVAGAGGGTYGFVFHRTYGGTSPTDANGVYTTLDWVEVQGASTFWTALGGFKLRPGRHFTIDVQAQYVGMKPATANTPQTGDVSVDLSGYCLGASVAFFL